MDEHLPIIYRNAEHSYVGNIGKWRTLARRRGVWVKWVTRQREGRGHSTDHTTSDVSLPTSPLPANSASSSSAQVLTGPQTISVTVSFQAPGNTCIFPAAAARHVTPSSQPDDGVGIAQPVGEDTSTSLQGIEHPQPTPSPTGDLGTSPRPIRHARSPHTNKGPNTIRSPNESKTKVTGAKGGKAKKVKKQNNKSASKTKRQKYCTPECTLHRKHDKNIIRCCLCMAWVHILCSGEDSDYTGIWTCKSGRNLNETPSQEMRHSHKTRFVNLRPKMGNCTQR